MPENLEKCGWDDALSPGFSTASGHSRRKELSVALGVMSISQQWGLSFPVTGVTNYSKLSGLK